ncbi:MAG: carboxymuconolactone decarboxylase family protein, partial [Syntrophothermus sp.]
MRLKWSQELPDAYDAMLKIENFVERGKLEPKLRELIKIRASQINGCAHCLDMHTKDAIAIGEDPQRIYVLSAWREAPFYSQRERAALAWCEALTLLPMNGAPDEVYAGLESVFNKEEIVELTMDVVVINSWNR